jgi:hypothetical protein
MRILLSIGICLGTLVAYFLLWHLFSDPSGATRFVETLYLFGKMLQLIAFKYVVIRLFDYFESNGFLKTKSGRKIHRSVHDIALVSLYLLLIVQIIRYLVAA